MKVIHFEIKVGHIGNTASKLSYQFGIKIRDNRSGKLHTENRDDVVYAEIHLPKNAPTRLRDPQMFVDEVELAETRNGKIRNVRKDARTLRVIIAMLPKELTVKENIKLAQEYVNKFFVEQGMCAALAVHDRDSAVSDKYNPHMHILLTTRRISMDGMGFSSIKCRAWNDRGNTTMWRKGLADLINEKFEEKGLEKRVTHKSYAKQNLDKEPQKYLHRGDYEREKRGIRTARGDENRAIIARNAERELAALELARLKDAELEATEQAREFERRKRIARHRLQQELDRGNELER